MDGVKHIVWKNGKTNRPDYINYSLSTVLPIVNKQVYVCHRLSPIDIKVGVWDRIVKQSKAKLAKLARLEYYRFYQSQVKERKQPK